MKKTYTKKQITEAIAYWKKQLKRLDEEVIQSPVTGPRADYAKQAMSALVLWLRRNDQLIDALKDLGINFNDRSMIDIARYAQQMFKHSQSISGNKLGADIDIDELAKFPARSEDDIRKLTGSRHVNESVVDTGNDTYMITTNNDGEQCIVPDTLDEIYDVIDAFNISINSFVIDSARVNDEYETDDPQDALDYFASKLSYLGGNGGEAKYRKGAFGKVKKFGFYFTDDDGSEIFCDCSCIL